MILEEATLNNTILFLKNANIFMELKNIRSLLYFPQGAYKK